MSLQRIAYGTDQLQFGELRTPEREGPHALVIVIHGGFWRAKYGLDYMRPVCDALNETGLATWNIEYRRIGNSGGGWPGTFDDVGAAAEHIASMGSGLHLDRSRIIAIGHSAGGHLAMWLAASRRMISGAISLAGVVDLRRAWEMQLSNNVVEEFLGGGPDEFPERYRFASPIEKLPLGIPQRLIHGTADDSVPFEISERYVQAARRVGDDAELITLPNANHFDVVNPETKEFAKVRAAVIEMCEMESNG